jgi:hypothetical protein
MLKSEFNDMSMKEEEMINLYAERLTSMSVRYGNLSGSLDDAALVKKLFDTVLERFINIVAGIEQFYDLKKLAFEEAIERLKAYEERTRRGAAGERSDTSQVLLKQVEWEAQQRHSADEGSGKSRSHEGRGCGQGHGRGGGSGGHGGQTKAGKHGAGKHDKSHIKCFKCHHYGHYANMCPSEKKKEEEAHHVKMVEYEPTVLLAKTVEPGQPECLLSENIQGELCLNGVHLDSEIAFH